MAGQLMLFTVEQPRDKHVQVEVEPEDLTPALAYMWTLPDGRKIPVATVSVFAQIVGVSREVAKDAFRRCSSRLREGRDYFLCTQAFLPSSGLADRKPIREIPTQVFRGGSHTRLLSAEGILILAKAIDSGRSWKLQQGMAEKSIPAELRVEPPPQVHGLISPSDEVDLLTPQLKSFVQKVVDDMADKIIAGLAPKQEASESVKRECWEVCRAVGGRCFVDGCMEEATELDHAVSGRHVSAEDMVPMCRGHNGQFGVPGSAQRSPDGKIAHERWLHHLRHYRKRQRLV